jgi:hypothetical protein
MTSSYALNCPGCGEANTADMAFCIFCGAPLKSGAGAATGSSLAPGNRPSTMAAAPRTCANCGQTDSLNSQFCIFCGSRVDGPMGGNGPASGVQAAVQPMAERQTDSRPTGSRMTGLVASIVAGVLGAGLGLGMSWWYTQSTEQPKGGRTLPHKGLVILTSSPYSRFEIVNDNRRYLAGKTGKEGDVILENVSPDSYHVRVMSSDGNRWESNIVVKPGEPYIIGGQQELFTQ